MNMENKEILQEALAEFTIQWTEQFVSGCIIPNINKAFENELVCYCLLQWKRHYDNYKMDKIRAIKKIFEHSDEQYVLYTHTDYQKYSDILYEFFAKVNQ